MLAAEIKFNTGVHLSVKTKLRLKKRGFLHAKTVTNFEEAPEISIERPTAWVHAPVVCNVSYQ